MIDDFKGMRIGIDGPFWLAQAMSTHNNYLRLFYLRLVKLRHVGVEKIVVVFDGKVKPDLKMVTLQERLYQRRRYRNSRFPILPQIILLIVLNRLHLFEVLWMIKGQPCMHIFLGSY